ncbi:VanZ family protein [Cellulomonas sp. URHB0016]
MDKLVRLYGVMAVVVGAAVVGCALLVGVAGAVAVRHGSTGRVVVARAACWVTLVVGAAVSAFLTLTPAGTGSGSSVNLVPLSVISRAGASASNQVQLVGNLLLLSWLGLLLPVVSRRVRTVLRTTAVVAAASVAIEVVQHSLHLGRSSALDDVLLNTLGGAAAAAVGVLVLAPRMRRLERGTRPGDEDAARRGQDTPTSSPPTTASSTAR